MSTVLRGWGAALLAIGLLDALWLGWLARDFYRDQLGTLMRPAVQLWPAAVFYVGYPLGLVLLALQPLPEGWGAAVARSALLGMLAYGAYDLSNLATLQGFSTRLALVDWVWGTLLSAAAGAAAYAAMRA